MTPTIPLPAGKFKAARLLLNKKHRLAGGTCLIEGRRFVAEAITRRGVVEYFLVTRRFADSPEGEEFLEKTGRLGVAGYFITDQQLGELADTVTSQGVLAVIRLPSTDHADFLRLKGEGLLLVALDGVADPGNIGTIIRTCAWFGVDGVLLSERSVELSNPKLLRSTMGAVFHVPIATGVNLAGMLPLLGARGFRILAAEAGGEPAAPRLRAPGSKLLLFGSEARGLSAEVTRLADATFGIAGSGRVESLNVAVAVGIALDIAVSGR